MPTYRRLIPRCVDENRCVGRILGARPSKNVERFLAEAEEAGVESMWAAGTYGSDAISTLACWGPRTTGMRCALRRRDGTRDVNFHNDVFVRMGWGDVSRRTEQEAVEVIPLETVEGVALVGPVDKMCENLRTRWASTLTTMILGRTVGAGGTGPVGRHRAQHLIAPLTRQSAPARWSAGHRAWTAGPDSDLLAGDAVGLIGDQEGHGRGDVLRGDSRPSP